jgi:uncharacterized membrane protein
MIRTPPGWGADMLTLAYHSITPTTIDRTRSATPAVRRIGMADLRWALARGAEDFRSSRTDVIFLCLLYPLLGLLMARLASGHNMTPLLFPLASGFALLGALAAAGLNEMSRRRELGTQTGWTDALGVFRSPSIGGICLLGGVLLVMFLSWLMLSSALYNLTLGPQPPESVSGFVHDVFYTHAGRTMAIVGIGTGFLFAAVAFTISVVSFPMLLDRNVSFETAIRTSASVVARNPVTMAVWGLVIATSLAIGSIPMLFGLVLVMPVLGHATWHLYRRAVPRTRV